MKISGILRRPPLESEILAAQSISKSESEAARKLGISVNTYKKYAELYGIYGRVKNRSGKGMEKPIKNEESGKYPLSRVFANEFPDYPGNRLRVRCIRAGKLEEKCDMCGFNEKRIADKIVPLILNFKDDNPKNMALENLQLLCYNHYFLYVNNPFGPKKAFKLDPNQ
jgi:hypothetical protein